MRPDARRVSDAAPRNAVRDVSVQAMSATCKQQITRPLGVSTGLAVVLAENGVGYRVLPLVKHRYQLPAITAALVPLL